MSINSSTQVGLTTISAVGSKETNLQQIHDESLSCRDHESSASDVTTLTEPTKAPQDKTAATTLTTISILKQTSHDQNASSPCSDVNNKLQTKLNKIYNIKL